MTSDNVAMILVPGQTTLPQRRLICAGCGMPFDCGTGGKAGGACWCMDENARLPMPMADAGDCLCPACLRAALSAPPEMRPA